MDTTDRVKKGETSSIRRVMKGVKPQVGTGQRLRDSGRFGDAGAAMGGSDEARDRVSDAPTAKRRVAKPLRELALQRETPRRLRTGVQR